MKKLPFITLFTVTLLTLHPFSLLFAMDPKRAEEVVEGIEKIWGGEQKETIYDRVRTQEVENDKTLESIVAGVETSTHQTPFSSFSCNTSSAENSETSYAACPAFSTDGVFQFAGNHLVRATESLRKAILRNPLTTLCVAASYVFPNALVPHFQVAATSDSNYATAEDTQVYNLRGFYHELTHQDENDAMEKEVLAIDHREATAVSEQAEARLRAQASSAFVAKKYPEYVNWIWAYDSLKASSIYQVKAIEEDAMGKTTFAVGYKKAAIMLRRAAEQFEQSAVAYAEGKQGEGLSWERAGTSFQAAADYYAKTSEALEAGRKILAVGYKEASITSQQAVDRFQLALETKVAGKNEEGNSWDAAGECLQVKANYYAKASEAEEAGKVTLASGYNEAIVTLQQAEDLFKQAVLAYTLGEAVEGSRVRRLGISLKNKAVNLLRAIKAEEQGDFRSAALSRSSKFLTSSSTYVKMGSLENQAQNLAKAIKAEDAGNLSLGAYLRGIPLSSRELPPDPRGSAEKNEVKKGWQQVES